MLYNNIKLNNKCIFYMSTCCTSFENLVFFYLCDIIYLLILYKYFFANKRSKNIDII